MLLERISGWRLAAGEGWSQQGSPWQFPLVTQAWSFRAVGLAARHGITCLNSPGRIDSGYRGEIQVLLVNTDPEEAYEVRRGDRVAQLVVVPVEQAHSFETTSFPRATAVREG